MKLIATSHIIPAVQHNAPSWASFSPPPDRLAASLSAPSPSDTAEVFGVSAGREWESETRVERWVPMLQPMEPNFYWLEEQGHGVEFPFVKLYAHIAGSLSGLTGTATLLSPLGSHSVMAEFPHARIACKHSALGVLLWLAALQIPTQTLKVQVFVGFDCNPNNWALRAARQMLARRDFNFTTCEEIRREVGWQTVALDDLKVESGVRNTLAAIQLMTTKMGSRTPHYATAPTSS